MKIYHVVAMAKNRVIGKDNKLPWHFPEDFKHFKKLTMGHTILMGRKTYESIGKPLPGRENFVLTQGSFQSEQDHLKYFSSIDEALDQVKTENCFIIGGSQLFEQTIDNIDGVYLTYIDKEYEGDVFYPEMTNKFVEKTRTRIQSNPLLDVVYYQKS